MKVMPYEKDRPFDKGLLSVLGVIKPSLDEAEEDFLLAIVGTTGTGKSRLMLWLMEEYLKEEADIKYIGLNRGDFATSMKAASEKTPPRFCANDEANINKRDSLTKYNKDTIDLYYSIRGLMIFHIWCNPSLNDIDRTFIEERIKGVIFIFTKSRTKPRLYYYFRKSDLIKIWEKYKNVKLTTLRKTAREYAYYRGWFKDYKGKLLEEYNRKKLYRMDEKVDAFYNKYGPDVRDHLIKKSEMRRRLMCEEKTFERYEETLLKEGKIKKADIVITAIGRKLYPKEYEDIFKKRMREGNATTLFKTSKTN